MSNRGEGSIGAILSVVALVAIGAFMFWLNRETRVIEAERQARAAALLEGERDLNASDILADPGAAVGRRAVMDSVRVAGGLGQGAFALALTDQFAFPVQMSSDAIQRLRMRNITLFGGDMVYVEGQIYTLNDSIRGAWVTNGFVDAAMAANIPGTPSFLLADSVLVY
jgi:hypothetical protein